MYWLDFAMRLMHILGAVILLGGVFFQRYAVRPALTCGPDNPSDAAQETLRRRAAVLTMLSALLLIISGLVNTARISMNWDFPNGEYHPLLGVKVLLAVVIFFMASVLTGRSPVAQRVRANPGNWLNGLVVCSLLLIGVAVAMRLAEREPKVAEVAAPAAAQNATPAE